MVERPERHRKCRVELVQVPAQPLLAAASLRDQVVAVVDEQLQLPQRLLAGARTVQQRLLQESPCDRERVDPVGLATHPSASALRCGQPWWDPHQPLACLEQRPLEAARDMPAVLNRPQPFGFQGLRPHHHVTTNRAASVSDRAAELVDGDRRQRVLVYVHSDHDHSTRLQPEEGRPANGQTSIEAKATLLSGHARRSRTAAATQHWKVSPRATFGIESAAAARVCATHRTPPHAENDIEVGNVTRVTAGSVNGRA